MDQQKQKRPLEEDEEKVKVLPSLKKAKSITKGFEAIVQCGIYLLDIKPNLGEKNVFCLRYFCGDMLQSCLKVQMSGTECSISILVGDFSEMTKKNQFPRLMSMFKDYLFQQDTSSIATCISREDYGDSLDKKCFNSFDMISCPNEWKGKGNYKLCRALLKKEGIADLSFYFNDQYEINNTNIIYV